MTWWAERRRLNERRILQALTSLGLTLRRQQQQLWWAGGQAAGFVGRGSQSPGQAVGSGGVHGSGRLEVPESPGGQGWCRCRLHLLLAPSGVRCKIRQVLEGGMPLPERALAGSRINWSLLLGARWLVGGVVDPPSHTPDPDPRPRLPSSHHHARHPAPHSPKTSFTTKSLRMYWRNPSWDDSSSRIP